MNVSEKSLRSGELARATGVSSDTLRHYESVGILPSPQRNASGYRLYAKDAADRVRLVQRALQLGFTLTELAEILQARDRGDVPCHRVLKMTEEKLHSLEQRIQELRRTQRYMRQLVRDWSMRLAHTAPGKTAMLLHSLDDKPKLRTKPAENLRRRKRT
jgi:DNA-binding transcriptional MerR regulator